MEVIYDSDDFDMKSVTGVDNPEELDNSTDDAANAITHLPFRMDNHDTISVYKTIDKKTGKLVYKADKRKSTAKRHRLKKYRK
mgnify:CR=1 FL=1